MRVLGGGEELGPYFIQHTKVYFHRIQLDTRSKTLKLLEKKNGKYLHDQGIGKHFLERAQKVLTIKERNIIN